MVFKLKHDPSQVLKKKNNPGKAWTNKSTILQYILSQNKRKEIER